MTMPQSSAPYMLGYRQSKSVANRLSLDWHVTKLDFPVEIKAGEIIAYRAWIIDYPNMLLRSTYVCYIWEPGEVATLMDDQSLDPWKAAGIHAFKDKNESMKYYYGPGIVHGRVALWGEVWEYELGYRAEFGRIYALDTIGTSSKPCHLRKLRKIYGV